jgi:hypothetical protein
METPSPPSPPGKSTDDVSPVAPQAPTDHPSLANTGPSPNVTSTTALDLSMFPTALQAQLAQYTVDLQDYKSARTSLACNHCRLRKIKCSGDRPVCSACLKSGAGRETCQYPQGHAKRRKRSAIAIESVRTVEEEDTSSTRTIKRHHGEVGDGTSLIIEQTSSSSSSTNRFQTLRSAATLPPTKKARTDDIQTYQTEVSGPIQDVNVRPHHRGASDVDRTGSQLRQQTEHEQSQGGDYDWSFFGDMHGPTPTMLSQQSHGQAGPSRSPLPTAYDHNHVEGGGGRRSKSVQEATKGTDRGPGCGRSTRLRVPYFR